MRNSGFAVYDDWLAPDAWRRLRAFLAGYRYFSVTPQGRRGPDGTLAELSGELSAGRVKLLGGPFVVKALDGPVSPGKIPYPSGTPLDELLDGVEARAEELAPWLGLPRRDWTLLGCGPRLYPAGCGLARHDDARFRGTFVLYAHERWEADWGGALAFDDGVSIEPAPNRCVFLKAGVPHAVRPVAPAAGARLRESVIGYTFRPSGAKAPGPRRASSPRGA